MPRDWVSPWWQAVNLPDMWDVCGVAVPSLTVWHTFALENIGNLYLYGGKTEPDHNDAESLLLFARLDMAGGRRLIACDGFRGRQMRRMYRHLRRLDWETINAACRDYVTTCTRALSRWDRAGGKPCSVPYQFHIVRGLSSMGVPIEVAWNMPYSLARCYYDAAAESNGDDSLMSIAAQEMEDNWDLYKDDTEQKKVELC